jgi:uncharacterized protein YkwD
VPPEGVLLVVGRSLRLLVAALTVTIVMWPATAHADDASEQQWFVDAINARRAASGAAPLEVDQRLVDIARRWAVHLADAGDPSHNANLANEAPPGWAVVAENVGVAWAHQLEVLEDAFEHSLHHFDNMVDPRFTKVGVGVVIRDTRMWVVEEFMQVAPVPVVAKAAPKPAPKPAPRRVPARRTVRRR